MSVGIYQILNLNNGKRYVGQSRQVDQRIKNHIRKLRKNKHKNNILQRAWNKHGEKSFLFQVLELEVFAGLGMEKVQDFLVVE